ncbi:MAG: DUF4129 domain-containing protein [Weeksellaceae bacterium]|nr:DUF4129 domain-containing protein [Bacteroidota bacterium]MCG2781785.1 DUF4129 domain-containing protein [Weeksellaceae bacterium]
MKGRFFILFFLIVFTSGFSQEGKIPTSTVVELVDSVAVSFDEEMISTDSVLKLRQPTDHVISPKTFQPKFQSKYQGEEFDYTTVKPRESLWQKVEKLIKRIIEAIFGDIDPNKTSGYAGNIMRFFAIVIIGFVLYFLIRFLLNKDGNFFFSKKNRKMNVASQDLHENIHEINFPETIDSFERQKDYRSAVRYRFLLVLKNLADKKLIAWNPEKTNRDYFAELKNAGLKENFKELVYIFDNVWYGEFEINESNYNHFKEKFLNFKA